MCHFINKIKISEEFKYLIKLCQILLVQTILVDEELKEMLAVVKMGSTYIERYFKKQRDDTIFKLPRLVEAVDFLELSGNPLV